MSFSTSPAHPVTYPLSLHDALPISLCSTQPRPHSRQSSVTDLSKYGNEPSHIQSIIARLQRRRASLISSSRRDQIALIRSNMIIKFPESVVFLPLLPNQSTPGLPPRGPIHLPPDCYLSQITLP